MKKSQKTEAQRQAEIKALQAFILECEKRQLYTKPFMKDLREKTLRIINIKLDKGIRHALIKFIAQAVKGSLALHSVVFA